MTCAELESLLCDYVDGTLGPESRSVVEQHLASCHACSELVRDASAAVAFMERAGEVEPPPELLTRILYHFPRSPAGARWYGRIYTRWLAPVLQPRFVMGFAMTVLSFSMLGRLAGIQARQLSLSDLDPARVWQSFDDRVHRAWVRAAKHYENLRLVYEIQTSLREWNQSEDQAAAAGQTAQPAPSSGNAGNEPGQRKSQ
jgi:anti-sigma factor RsiW